MLNKFKRYFEKKLRVLALALLKLGLTPNACTTLSLLVGVLSSITLCTGNYLCSTALILLSGILDALDGTVARLSGKVTKLGAFIDSMFDRLVDSAVILSLCFNLIQRNMPLEGALAALFAALSLMISYARARAESLGVEIKGVGLMERAERLIAVAILVLLLDRATYMFTWLLLATVVLSGVTLAERIYRVVKAISLREK
ncbi:MAG: hypothetical protein DRJ52_00610 [Thermoprotei archaeon]|nr:MAG: hypothetical protein DRJ52_00610 [Thermoprotei archaeon]RLF00480.1 MAG: hypothetical protein DRJ63_02220 [Thermoprotei archaeon]HDI75273.1 CDP-alcohol phosphatidyltransferase family protein [Thermoprotei archaeon]